MKHYRFLILTGCLCVWNFLLHAAAPTAQLASANATYQNNEYASAIQQYEAILQNGYHSEALYYNLGNSYYRTKDFARAVLNYERALLIDPNDADTRHNLHVLRAQLPDDIQALPAFFLSRWWNSIGAWFSTNYWAMIAVVLLWLGLAGLTLWLLGNVRLYKKIGFIGGVSLLLLSILAFMLANTRNVAIQNSQRAIVMEKEVVLRSAPDAQSKAVFDLHAGATVRLLDQIGAWHKVALQNGEQGWLPDTSFEKI